MLCNKWNCRNSLLKKKKIFSSQLSACVESQWKEAQILAGPFISEVYIFSVPLWHIFLHSDYSKSHFLAYNSWDRSQSVWSPSHDTAHITDERYSIHLRELTIAHLHHMLHWLSSYKSFKGSRDWVYVMSLGCNTLRVTAALQMTFFLLGSCTDLTGMIPITW